MPSRPKVHLVKEVQDTYAKTKVLIPKAKAQPYNPDTPMPLVAETSAIINRPHPLIFHPRPC